MRKLGLVLVMALMALTVGMQQSEAAGATKYHVDSRSDFTTTACGIVFTGWIHEQQQYTLNPKGQLNFHYHANAQATGVDSAGRTYRLHLNNKEVDHIIATTPPDLAPYGGSLQAWVEDNMDIIVEINSNYFERVNGKGSTRLKNHWVFQVNHNGTTVDKVTFKTQGLSPVLVTP